MGHCMAEDLHINENWTKEERYEFALQQCKALIDGEPNLIANLANITAVLKQIFDFYWVGFYLEAGEGELVLGPFQGPVACTRIPKGKGVCGAAASKGVTVLVPDVNEFPGHISCSSASLSEIVVPLMAEKICKLVLDVDSNKINDFDAVDKKYLEILVDCISIS